MSKVKSALIHAVGYLRKSTKGERGDGKQRQEKSIGQQKAEIVKLAKDRFEVVEWFEDEGVSGWKRGGKRPDFQKMLDEVNRLGAHAIVCDNIDRFSRAAFDEVQEDVNALRKAGVRWIVTASHGEYDLGARFDIACILKFTVSVWSSCEYSRQLSRRISLARRNAAEEGRRTGGKAAYGLANDGNGGLILGDPAEVETVRWLFDQFAADVSLCKLAGALNDRKVPGPRGGSWYVRSIALLMRQRCYRGDFTYNQKHAGQFYGINDKGEVVEAADLNGKPGKLYLQKGKYEPLIAPAIFDKVQARLDRNSKDRSQRKRVGYPLTGVLVCDHCGGRMHGCKMRGNTVYRCGSDQRRGAGACGNRQVREDAILPFILKTLGREIEDLKTVVGLPPAELSQPHKQRDDERKRAVAERDKLAARIAKAVENLMYVDDPRNRKAIDMQLTGMRDELEKLESRLSIEPEADGGYTVADMEALLDWWRDFEADALSVPVPAKADADESVVLADPRKVNMALAQLGCEIRLRWETEMYNTSGGVARNRHVLARGRFRLGQQSGKLTLANGTGALPFGNHGGPITAARQGP